MMMLYLVGPEAAPNSQLYSAARSRDQAAILFNLASKMCRMNPVLMQYVAIKDSAKEIHCPELGSYYRALSAEATTAYGFRDLSHTTNWARFVGRETRFMKRWKPPPLHRITLFR
jgi:phage terminase large subunit-like protein